MTEEIRQHLEKGVLNTTPGTRENEAAVKALAEFERTSSEIAKNEEELKLKRESVDNALIDKRDETEFESKKADRENLRNWVETIIKAVGLVVNSVVAAVIIHNDTTGKPLLSGPGRQLVGNTFRRK